MQCSMIQPSSIAFYSHGNGGFMVLFQSMAAGDNGQLFSPARQHVALGHRLDTTTVTRHTRPMADSIA